VCEYILKVFDNRVLIDEGRTDGRSFVIRMFKSRRMKWAEHVARMGRRTHIGKARRKEPLGRPRCRRVDNIKMDLRQVEWGGMDWIGTS
jgi:hypothetical protein